MKVYENEEGFCKLLHYNGLWRVEYDGVPGPFRKSKMACSCIKDGCDQDCEILKKIPEIKNPSMEWHMKDEKGNMLG